MTRDEAGDVEALVRLVEEHRRCGHDGGKQGRYTWTCGMASEAYGLVGWESSHLTDAILASDWLAARDAEQRRLGAEAVVAAVLSDAPRLNAELRHDGTSEPGMAAYIEGWRDAYIAARAAAQQVSER